MNSRSVKVLESGLTLWTVLEWMWLLLVPVGGWMVRKMLLLETTVAVLQKVNEHQNEQRKELLIVLREHRDVWKQHNEAVLQKIDALHTRINRLKDKL